MVKDIRPGAALGLVGFADGGDDLGGHLHAKVSADERRLDVLKGGRIELGGAGDDAFDFVRQLAMRFLQAGLNLAKRPMAS